MLDKLTLAMGKVLQYMGSNRLLNTPGSNDTGAAAASAKITTIMQNIVGPCLTVLGSIGVIYIIILGVQYAKAESEDKRAECKKRMVNLAIGLVVMIVMIAMCFLIQWDAIVPQLFGWIPGAENIGSSK